ncbi:hypothetical protein CY652_21900 [Burkholderia sp. WAC0059]|uniref:CesT family type III secretion system chaperone n=1 Tax=Burkholderia sp. WAC0059 TaxID=2066022 RepID=UPI000C7F207E|nr:CesT family type III secretion system chaperone [Burkholderia sp. WAC0059]PLZ00299.1 hypothetical protein CY652_21900 [Burkholderia sp. WAC0059]
MMTSSHDDAFGRFNLLDGLLRDGALCLGFSERDAERSVAERSVEVAGVNVSVIPLRDADEFSENDVVLAAPLPGVDAHSQHAIEFLFEINLANALAGGGAFGRDAQGQILLLKAMRTEQLDGVTLAAHLQWMAALVASVREELGRLH